ncbi:type II CRISPR-associated endonuclease Cas1 [Neisseria dumasiana]|uniref:CRISPR-associated endonuclease Cas1 n=1 Tax=Neisseria dumasiana TaxID=1931275 RepID=A0A1X3DIW4_9NEIS|nr:type II CRISPR-associated endonuclease Cas1 [Neisseria dumasiana]OSI22797.1 subtype II CRISPR-associated endonuclease Cas1 [Neisseria dumasiana]OSI35769.1 subtype II CRISPR-associated endonuclease Cas1 [Neisseria dumasiana]UOO85366.1 type II CRISPR-associated endonuclease Cas1 [Neisseria dumasiana]
MTWRSILISRPARLSLQQNHLLIQQDEAIPIPLEDIAVIVVEAREVILTAPLLSALAQYGITLLTCDEQFLPCGQWLPFAQYHRSLKVLKQQINMTEPQKKQLWQQIVKQKIRNQAWLLDYSGHDIAASRLNALADSVKSGDKNFAESQAAALHFRVLFGEQFTRSYENSVNAHLNYGYSILRSAIARALVQYGFLPALGLHHRSELNPFNLADDLIEPYRPIADLWVYDKMLSNSLPDELTPASKQQLISLLCCQAALDGYKYSVLAAIDRTIQSFQTAVSQNKPKLLKLPQMLRLKVHDYE